MMEKGLIKENFPVLDMTCAACAARVDKALNKSKGVRCASVNLASNMATVEYDPAECSPEALKKAVVDAGYDLVIGRQERGEDELEKEHVRKMKAMKRKLVFSIVFSIPVFVISMFFPDMPYGGYVMLVLSGAVLVWPAGGIFAGAFRLLKHFSSNMDTLVATSTGVAYVFSTFNLFFPDFWLSKGVEPHLYFDASSMVVTFILLGRWLEERAKGKASSAIRELMGLRPDTVGVLGEDSEIRVVPIGYVKAGDIVVVRPGERIAVDGSVIKGDSYVDESMLNGEPLPSHKYAGEKVFAGSVNGRGSLYFKAEKVGEGTLLSRIISLVRDAQGSKAPVQRLVDKIASVFVPVIIGIAFLSAVVWLIADPSEGMTHALLAFVTVLVIACPCALGLATPTAIMVGVGKAARNGILVKDAQSIEIAKKTDVIVLDKTGTITEGRPAVTDVFWAEGENMPGEAGHRGTGDAGHGNAGPGDSRTDVRPAILKSLELLSEHPIGEAIASYFDCRPVDVTGFAAMPGKGVRGTVGEETYFVGNETFLKENGVLLPDSLSSAAAGLASQAKTAIWFSDSKEAIAVLGVADRIKPTSVEAVSKLRKMGIEVHILTGDSKESAEYVARVCGIENCRYGVLPDEKSSYIRSLKASGKTVAMVGDGINDSAALAEADLSIAMGNGSDIAMDVAGMTIVSSDLRKIPDAIRISAMTVQTIRENLFWAFIYNLIGVPIAAGALYPINGFLLNPMIAGAAMAFSSVSVVTNSLRLGVRKLWPGKKAAAGIPEVSDKTNVPETIVNNNEIVDNKNNKVVTKMKKEYEISGMMCMNCRKHVENALNSIEGVHATVTLDPPVAVVEFDSAEVPVEELQKRLAEEGDYRIKAR
ncbi:MULTISPECIES: heavy metal translocating P-type ATPase [unclassified Muribaculum]|uniref:heavy metal translocating P-type ATPase n=1 Tax=unclassified Muribaculum TaxID=2622126 RepID=UPI000B38ED37|nr:MULTISPECIES: heavy metal translocating P-type ATPase [unclassified Muribaculum]